MDMGSPMLPALGYILGLFLCLGWAGMATGFDYCIDELDGHLIESWIGSAVVYSVAGQHWFFSGQ